MDEPAQPEPIVDDAASRGTAFDQLREHVADEPAQPEPVSDDDASRNTEFELLRNQVEDEPTKAEPILDEAASRGTAFDQLREQATDEPTQPKPVVDQATTMDAAFERLREQVADEPTQPEPAPTEAEPVVQEAATRDAAFQELRKEAMALESADADLSGPQDAVSAVSPERPVGMPTLSASEETRTTPEGSATTVPDVRTMSVLGKIKSPFTRLAHPKGAGDGAPRSLVGVVRHGLNRLSIGSAKEVTSVTIEHASIKVLKTRGFEVTEYRNIPANPRYFREGLVSDAPRMAALLQGAIEEVNGAKGRVIGAVPGYQTTLRALELPNVKAMDPKQIIPQEARRKLGISTDNSYLTWHRMSAGAEMARWLVLSATNRSISSLFATTQAAGLRMSVMDLRPFALARALNQPDAICAWTAPDGCDAVVVRDWVPMTHQAAYWGAGAMGESADLVNRVTEVVESTIVAHDMQNPEMLVAEETPVYVTGSPAGQHVGVAAQVAESLRRPQGEPEPPLSLPSGFPLDDFIVNIGLALWGV